MKSKLHKLSAVKVARSSDPGYLLDGGGLYLQVTRRTTTNSEVKGSTVTDRVSKSWCFRYRDRATGKLHELGLGPYPEVSLEKAREKATELREQLREGKDPKGIRELQRQAQKIERARGMTFAQAATACIADKRPGWKNAKHAEQWTQTIATYALPILGSLPVSAIDLPLVRKVLDPIWTTKNETASRVRQRLESILDWATVSGYRAGENPARWKGHLDHLLPKPSKVQSEKHHAALPYDQMGAFVLDLHAQQGIGALALEFTILTAARTGEVIGAQWEEIDLEKALWTIPAERMKAAKEHIVPLSPRALEILEALEAQKRSSHVFPGWKKGTALSNMAMTATLKRMHREEITVHGFRSTFRDWAGEQTDFSRELIEHALAHHLKDKAEAAYHRSTLPEKRRKLMEAWAEYCATEALRIAAEREEASRAQSKTPRRSKKGS